MVFDGPGIYQIVPYQAPNQNMNYWGGGMQPGAPVKFYHKSSPPTDNEIWEVALVTKTNSGEQDEYLIINVRNGYYLTAVEKNAPVTCSQISPRDPKARWTMQHFTRQGQYQVFSVNSVSDNGQLNARGSGTSEGTDILSYQKEDGDNSMWYFDRQSG